MLRGVVRRSWIVVPPTMTVRLGPSVRNTTFAGTCSVRPRVLAAYAPAGCRRTRSRPAIALATASGGGESEPSCGCSFG